MVKVFSNGYEALSDDDLITPVGISKLNLTFKEGHSVVAGENAFEFELPVSKKKVVFKFLTGKDELNLQTEQARRQKKKLGGDVDNVVTSRLLHAILSIDGIDDKNKISTFVRNMPARDSRMLRKFMDENEPGVEMKSWMQCPHCFEDSEVNLPIGASFFWPDS